MSFVYSCSLVDTVLNRYADVNALFNPSTCWIGSSSFLHYRLRAKKENISCCFAFETSWSPRLYLQHRVDYWPVGAALQTDSPTAVLPAPEPRIWKEHAPPRFREPFVAQVVTVAFLQDSTVCMRRSSAQRGFLSRHSPAATRNAAHERRRVPIVSRRRTTHP